MNDPKKKLVDEGFTVEQVDLILDKAVEMQRKSEEKAYMDKDELREGAEASGINPKFIDEAIKVMREEEQRNRIETVKKKNNYRTYGIIAAAVIVAAYIFTYTSLNMLYGKVEAKEAQLENVLERKRNLIPKLSSLARQTNSYEQSLFESITRYQSEINNTDNFSLKRDWEEKLDQAVTQVLNNMESSGGSGIESLKAEIEGAENRIAVERKRYNEAVVDYNRRSRGFFTSIIRPFTGFPKTIETFRTD